jgi:uncharacterized membrane protein YuzA (DUF378 family)
MDFIRKYYLLILCCIPVISLGLHFHILNLDLVGYHVWRQTETQTVINNFYRGNMNIFYPRVNDHADIGGLHRMEFPLMQWLFALFYKIFGPGIVVSRVLTFLTGLCSVYGMFYLCDTLFKDKVIATICAWCFNFSPVFYFYTINPMPDNLALCCGIWCAGLFFTYAHTQKNKYLAGSALFLCLATLIKLPFILYGSFVFAFLLVQLKKKEFSHRQLLYCTLLFILSIVPAALWYATVIPGWGNNPVLKGMTDMNTDFKELQHIFLATIYSTLPELLINYGSVLFFIAGLYFFFKKKKYSNKNFPLFLLWAISVTLYFLFEMNAITLVHDYYLFPFLPLIFLIVAFGAFSLLSLNNNFLTKLTFVCLAVLPLTAFLRADTRWDKKDPEFNATYFHYKDEIRHLTPPGSFCVIGNDPSHYILLYYIDRKGWAFDNDQLDEKLLSDYISKGARYLFLDSHIDDNPGIKAHLEQKIFEKDSVRVYKLK